MNKLCPLFTIAARAEKDCQGARCMFFNDSQSICTISGQGPESEYTPPKSEPQYKVGDKVMLREGLVVNEKYGKIALLDSMAEYAGKVGTISEITHDGCYLMDEWGYGWSAEMLQPAPEKPKLTSWAICWAWVLRRSLIFGGVADF